MLASILDLCALSMLILLCCHVEPKWAHVVLLEVLVLSLCSLPVLYEKLLLSDSGRDLKLTYTVGIICVLYSFLTTCSIYRYTKFDFGNAICRSHYMYMVLWIVKPEGHFLRIIGFACLFNLWSFVNNHCVQSITVCCCWLFESDKNE